MEGKSSRREFIKTSAVAAAGVSVGMFGLLRGRSASALPAVQRPLADFLDAQGVTDLFWPPVKDYVGWSVTGKPPFALVDYAGIAYKWLLANDGPDIGTTISGSVSERPLKDGTAEVSVILHTKNALTVVCPGTELAVYPPEDRVLWFGNLAPAVAAGAAPALGEAQLKLVFANTAPGAPMPDMVAAFILGSLDPALALRQLAFRSNSTGLLYEAAGLGPDGTPGRCIVSQTGLFMTQFKGATADGFPAEVIDLRAIG